MQSRISRLPVLVLAAFAASLGGCSGKSPTSASAPGSAPPAKTALGEPAFTMTAEEFADAFRNDTKKYEGKVIAVSGKIVYHPLEKLIPDEEGCYGILIGTQQAKAGRNTQCRFSPDVVAKLPSLTPGQHIKVKGKCQDLGNNIALVNAELLEAGPDPAIIINAPELAKAFTTNKEAAKNKYASDLDTEKWLLLEGNVSEIDPNHPSLTGSRAIVLEGGKHEGRVYSVVVFPLDEMEDDFGKVKKGDKVKLKGRCDGLHEENGRNEIRVAKAVPAK